VCHVTETIQTGWGFLHYYVFEPLWLQSLASVMLQMLQQQQIIFCPYVVEVVFVLQEFGVQKQVVHVYRLTG